MDSVKSSEGSTHSLARRNCYRRKKELQKILIIGFLEEKRQSESGCLRKKERDK
jgi:hypothetical protein